MNIYLGPYLKCHYGLIPKNSKKNYCPNKKCSKHDLHVDDECSYCSKCGSKIESKATKIFVLPNINFGKSRYFSEIYNSDDALEQYLFYIPKTKFSKEREFYFKFDNGFSEIKTYPFENINIQKEIENLKTTFSKEINRLETIFSHIDFEWGIVEC